MPERFVTRGFVGRRESAGAQANRIPPGQHLVKDFPVLSAGPTPRTDLAKWTFRIEGLVKEPVSWGWNDFQKLPAQDFVKTSAVSPSGPSSTPAGAASRWTSCS